MRAFVRNLFILNVVFIAAASFAETSVSLGVELNPMGSFEATSTAVSGSAKKQGPKIIAQNIVLDLTSLDSGIELRDKHMKEEYFETKRFPKAVLLKAIGKGGKFAGILMIRNTKAKISGTYKLDGSTIEAEFSTPMSAYKIKKASYMGVGVENMVKVKVKIPLKG
jgi:hypothetical protein